ncbi:molecular chaperone DjlA [Pseudomonas stutzeri]|nr:molecular chaperone DjlA [Stutzerimonas stutzeri]
MLWPGSVLGGLAGFVLASVPGGLLGGLLGHWLDRRLQLHDWADLRERLAGHGHDTLDALRLMQLLGRLAAANPHAAVAQRRQLRREAQRAGLAETAALLAFERGRRGACVEAILAGLRQRPARVDTVLRAAWRMAWAGDCCAPAARALLGVWAVQLGCAAAQLAALESQALGRGVPSLRRDEAYRTALQLLGVTADTPPAAIRQAYRRLRSRHHPDKLGRADAAALAAATEQSRRLQAAWELVRARHGLR